MERKKSKKWIIKAIKDKLMILKIAKEMEEFSKKNEKKRI